MIASAPTSAACYACRTRDCCRDRDASLTGSDIVRIARALSVPPISFAEVRTAPTSDVILRRRIESDGRTACVFLLSIGPARRRLCGLGDLAPLGCRLHPAEGVEPGTCWRPFTHDEVAPVRAALASAYAAEQMRWTAFVRAHAIAMSTRAYPLDAASFLDVVLAAYGAP